MSLQSATIDTKNKTKISIIMFLQKNKNEKSDAHNMVGRKNEFFLCLLGKDDLRIALANETTPISDNR